MPSFDPELIQVMRTALEDVMTMARNFQLTQLKPFLLSASSKPLLKDTQAIMSC
jgi:hypothetical protein